MNEIDTDKIRARLERDEDGLLGDLARLCDALDEARAEIMAHQVGDGYEKGYEHGRLAADKNWLDLRQRAEKAEADAAHWGREYDDACTMIDQLVIKVEKAEATIERVRALCDNTPDRIGFHCTFPGSVTTEQVRAALDGEVS